MMSHEIAGIPVGEEAGTGSVRRVLCTGGSGFIGTRLVDRLIRSPGTEVLNVDVAQPARASHRLNWQRADILDATAIHRIFAAFQPTHLVHLAARTDMDGESLAEYGANVFGTQHVLDAARDTRSLRLAIITSSQHVREPGAPPSEGDEDYVPYRAYGRSKVETERRTRQSGLECAWTIVRPTTIWGPGSEVLARGLWRTLAKGLYVHPRHDDVIRSYGYVDNVVQQLVAILSAPCDVVDRKVLYLGDPCIEQSRWIDAFALALTGRRVRTAPRSVLLAIAIAGEAARRVGVPSPLFLSRFKNMITTNVVPVERTIELLGASPFSLEEGVRETVRWLREEEYV